MVAINPQLLEEEVKTPVNGMARQPQKRGNLSWFIMLQNAFSSVLKRTVLRMQIDNDTKYMQVLSSVQKQLKTISDRLMVLKVDFPEIKIPPTNVTVNNPDMLASADKIIGKVADFDQNVAEQSKDFSNAITYISQELVNIEKAIKENKVNFPQVQKIQGEVKVKEAPTYNFDKLLKGIVDIKKAIEGIRIDIPQPQAVKFPEMPKSIAINEGKAILKALEAVGKKLDELPKSFPDIEIPASVSISNFPPQKYPLPVKNIDINPLRGYAKSRNITVTSSPTPLPDEVLAYRRSLVVYNNSSTTTMYVGGVDVSSTNGMPVPPNSYSPAFDAGQRMIIYGVVASGSVNVRVLELSNDNVGSS